MIKSARSSVRPQAVLDGDGKVYVRWLGDDSRRSVPLVNTRSRLGWPFACRLGVHFLQFSRRSPTGAARWKLPFTVDAKPDSNSKLEFANAKDFCFYRHLLGRNIAGETWFHHQLRELHSGQADEIGPRRSRF